MQLPANQLIHILDSYIYLIIQLIYYLKIKFEVQNLKKYYFRSLLFQQVFLFSLASFDIIDS